MILVISVYTLIMFCQFYYYNFLCTLVGSIHKVLVEESQFLICVNNPPFLLWAHTSGYFQGLYISRMGPHFNFTNGYLSNTCNSMSFYARLEPVQRNS